MNLFKKKEDIPEIPIAPPLPEVNFEVVRSAPLNLPTPSGDSRDVSNRDVIKSAIEDSSEKNSGDAGENRVSSDNFQESKFEIKQPPKQENAKPFSLLGLPPSRLESSLPNLPKYTKNSNIEDMKLLDAPEKAERLLEPEELGMAKDGEFKEAQTVKKDFNETIFVRIDKFNSAKRDVDEIERDLRQIENVLEKIGEVKMKEDEEIAELNKNLEEIKIRLGQIDNEIFNRI